MSITFDQPQFATSADGTKIAYYDHRHAGNPHGRELVLGHASGFCAAVWCDVVEALSRDFQCVSYDTRGHGQSGQPSQSHERYEAFDWERLADDLDAVIDSANLDRPIGVGHSSGAAAQVLLSERGDYLAAMYLFEPVIFDFDPPRGPWRDRDLCQRTRNRRVEFASREAAFSSFRERGPFSRLTDNALHGYVNHGFVQSDPAGQADQSHSAIRLILDPEDEAEIYALATDHFGYQRLGQITCPTAVAHGSTSKSFDQSQMLDVAKRIQQGEFCSFDGVGHFAPLEDPHVFAQRVISFAQRVLPTEHSASSGTTLSPSNPNES